MRLRFESHAETGKKDAAPILATRRGERPGSGRGSSLSLWRTAAQRCALAVAGGALFFLCGCFTAEVPDIATHVDPNTQIRTDLIPENFLEGPGGARELLWLNASRVFKDYRNFDYYLEVHYEAAEETGLLKVSPGQSLVVTADGIELKFNGSGSLNARRQRGGMVSEDAIYIATPDELRSIAYADHAIVKVFGANGVLMREFKPANFEKFRKFVMLFVDGGS